jgi:hypothetical protein
VALKIEFSIRQSRGAELRAADIFGPERFKNMPQKRAIPAVGAAGVHRALALVNAGSPFGVTLPPDTALRPRHARQPRQS